MYTEKKKCLWLFLFHRTFEWNKNWIDKQFSLHSHCQWNGFSNESTLNSHWIQNEPGSFVTQFTFWPTSREFCLALYRVSKYLNILILVCFKGLWVHFRSTSAQTTEINHICVHKINDTDVINSSEASSDSSSLLIDLLCPTILKGVIICYKQTLIIPAVNKFLMAMNAVPLTNSFTNNRKCSMHAMRAFSILLRLI